MIRVLVILLALLLPWAWSCGGAPPVNRDNTTAAQMWCIAGTAPAPFLRCSDTEAQCAADKAAADADAAVLSVSPCRATTVAVRLSGEPGG